MFVFTQSGENNFSTLALERTTLLVGMIQKILVQQPVDSTENIIGYSRGGNPIQGFIFGTGEIKISLIAGCHADEPVGPMLLRKLVSHLKSMSVEEELLKHYTWIIVPHANPDGESINNQWWDPNAESCDLLSYLKYRVRELPGDDIEFGFPRNLACKGAREENDVIYRWWCSLGFDFSLHASLHGMGFSAGPWYLIELAWQDRIEPLKKKCLQFVESMHYRVHDVERNGEKGFFRLGKGFCTRPDSENMKKFFLEQGDEEMASKFYPSSMEVMRNFSTDCLTVVSEMPLFILPDVGEELGPPDPKALEWKERIEGWMNNPENEKGILEDAHKFGLKPMNIQHQMLFQWDFVMNALDLVIQE